MATSTGNQSAQRVKHSEPGNLARHSGGLVESYAQIHLDRMREIMHGPELPAKRKGAGRSDQTEREE